MIQYKSYCDTLRNNSKIRVLQNYNAKDVLNFSSNDYLALSKNCDVIESGIVCAKKYGAGSTGSRLLSGNCEIFEQFENAIAIDKKTESALIFNSGYQANLSVLSALCNTKVLQHIPIVFFDKLNHASLYHAIYLSGAQLVRYPHNNLEILSDLLKKYENDGRTKFIVSESVFGMDGDVVDVCALQQLANKYDAMLFLDEAHATGILGVSGLGLSTLLDMNERVIVMGTFSKAVGVAGAYVSCCLNIKQYLMQAAGGFIYSTSQSPFVIGAAQKSWEILKTMDKERQSILKNAMYIKEAFNIDANIYKTNIVAIVINDCEKVLQIRDRLRAQKIIVSAIRPPTSPTSRIRIAINASHTFDDIKNLVKKLNEYI